MGGKFHLKLNMDKRPIANKYREGKMKRTLKRESKVLEIVNRETIGFRVGGGSNQAWVYSRCTCCRRRSTSVVGAGEHRAGR